MGSTIVINNTSIHDLTIPLLSSFGSYITFQNTKISNIYTESQIFDSYRDTEINVSVTLTFVVSESDCAELCIE